MIQRPAKAPCGSCPYRRDAPSALWSADEYAKLPEFDKPTGDQPPYVFMCHQNDGHLCAGWCGTHDMEENLGLRMAQSMGKLSQEEAEAAMDYVSPVPLWPSGAEAARHGLAEIRRPGAAARRTIQRLSKRLQSDDPRPGRW